MLRALALSLTLAAAPALADIERIKADADVATVMHRLEVAVAGAGATIFARIDHGGGAVAAGLDLAPSELLIFGNPKLGTPAMQADPRAGLFLPLKVLVYQDADGAVWVAWEDVAETFDDLEINADAEYLGTMSNVIRRFAETAASE